MNGSRFYRLLVVLVILPLAACVQTLVPIPAPTAITTTVVPVGCVDFSGFASGTKWVQPFTLPPKGFPLMSPYTFDGLGRILTVKPASPVLGPGLQFDDVGLEISLPNPASSVKLDVASLSQPVILGALDTNGVAVAKASVPSDHALHNIALSGQGIVKVILTGGGYEGFLFKICS